MKINALEYFVMLAQSTSISEAAQKLYISQPTLTKALRQLEQELGVKLFERSYNGIELTPAGKQILPQAKQVLSYYQEWLTLGTQTSLQSLNVYVARSFSDMFLPNIVINYRQRYPHLPINFTVTRDPDTYISRNTSNPVIALLACNEESMQTYAKAQGCNPIILLRGETRCLVSRYSPLVRKTAVSLDDLKDYFLVLPGSSTHIEPPSPAVKITQKILSTHPGSHIISVESLSNVISQVAENPHTYANSFYPALQRYSQVKSGELVALPFLDHRDPMNLCLFYSRQAYQQHPLMAEFITSICSSFQSFSSNLEA